MRPIEFRAPWSRRLRVRTVAGCILIAFCALLGFLFSAHQALVWPPALIVLPAVLLLLGVLTSIRGYSLDDRQLVIRRLATKSVYPLSTLVAVQGLAEATQGSICLCANCGLFSFSGWYWNRRLGVYRAAMCDPSRSIVLRFGAGTVVIAPHDPQQFIARARTFLQTAGFPG